MRTIAMNSNRDARMTPRKSKVQHEIGQDRPFLSAGQEATVALLRTASVVRRALARVIEPSGLSLPQYNALRIIRGAGAEGIPTLAVRERMIEEGTTITRLLDRLEETGLIRRRRGKADRRLVTCAVTPAGRRLLDRLDPLVDDADSTAMDVLSEAEQKRFIRLLDRVRDANAERGAPRTMTRRD
jgi:MarR family transcriptional regulator, organic hydroperoxide resistance regulator